MEEDLKRKFSAETVATAGDTDDGNGSKQLTIKKQRIVKHESGFEAFSVQMKETVMARIA